MLLTIRNSNDEKLKWIWQPYADEKQQKKMKGTADPDQVKRTLDLISRYQDGERTAYEEIFELHKDRVYSLAIHLSQNSADAEDISQSVFLKLLERLNQFRGEAEFTTWLYRIVVNAFLDHTRRKKKHNRIDPEAEPDISIEPLQHEAMERMAVTIEVKKALSQLSPKLRVPLLLKYSADLSYSQIGEVLGTSSGTVASRLNRGHVQLARKLKHLKGQVR